ncbi:MAG: DUF2236 domain-containing protein [Actinobacteria bacterium]|uniref:Unannotated protein n=1 Tax=freshwater metagenome TaxID=449393 RepID=A0A6J6PW90_9ZZZZ|nr:DUF2236 domain-containing protein [Actinomycetota bacterium]
MSVSAPTTPSRFREAEARGVRLGRPLRHLGRVREIDEALMARIAQRLTTVDEPGARVAAAIRTRSAGERVTMSQVHTALSDGIEAVPDAPPALVDFFALAGTDPAWLDRELLARGARTYRRFGQSAADVLLQLSLIGGYRFGGPTDLLVATGGLTGDLARRRLGETQKWAATLSEPGALDVGGDAWAMTLHVRLMHALVNLGFEPQWDVARWGRPINQADQAATLGLFDAVVLIGVRALGIPVSREDSRAVMHFWRYVGWLMGVDDDFLVETERERHRINYHLLLSQADLSEAGPLLAGSIVDAQRDLHFERLPRLRGWWARERLLSMLTVFLGPASMRELALPLRPPWATPLVLVRNTIDHRVLGRTAAGRARLDRRGDEAIARLMLRYFGPETPEVGALS